MVKAIIFDLDDCSAPAREVEDAPYQPAFDTMRGANHGHLSGETLHDAFEDLWGNALDVVAAR